MRGGKREGSGRPAINPEDKRVQMSLSVSPATKKNASFLRSEGVPVTMLIERYIEHLMATWLEEHEEFED